MEKKSQNKQKERLFEEKLVPAKTGSNRLFDVRYRDEVSKPVECLGTKFPNDDARRAYFTEKLCEKLKDPEFRKIEGFPIGEDENILAMSDPPYYTACPNPFLDDFVKHCGTKYTPKAEYHCEPFTSDVSEGKTDPVYTAHGYYTKVPHRAIMRYILHYTKPGDIVFDGFCGTGMTAVAAQLCGNKQEVEKLGYQVKSKGQITEEVATSAAKSVAIPISEFGARRAILNDLSPAATFIAGNYVSPVDSEAFEKEASRILKEIEDEFGWMYETIHSDGKTKGRINYTVWSDVFSCGDCGKEILFAEEALDKTGSVRETFPCPHCGIESKKNDLELRYESNLDRALGRTVSLPKRVPVLINYTAKGTKQEKKPDKSDLALLRRIAELPLSPYLPTLEMPDMQMRRVGRMQPARITHIHQFFLPRATQVLPALWRRAFSTPDRRLRNILLFFVEQAIWGMSVLARYVPTHYSQVNQYLSGVFYVASQIVDPSPCCLSRVRTSATTNPAC